MKSAYGADLNSFFQCFETRRSLDKCCDYVPPTDSQHLWGEWRSGLAWTLGFCVMIGGSVERLRLLLIDSNFVL